MQLPGLPRYADLDLSGEALAAASRMEARSRAPASDEMFAALVQPLLDEGPRLVLDVGCGTAALSRRIARALPSAEVHASDKSEGMLAAAGRHCRDEQLPNVTLARWDATDAASFPFGDRAYDLIVSSVVIPYLSEAQTLDLTARLAEWLSPGGVLAFLEQDLLTDSITLQPPSLAQKVLVHDARPLTPTLCLGLRPLLRAAGLTLLPRQSFLWQDPSGSPYVQEMVGKAADAAVEKGKLTVAEREELSRSMRSLIDSGDFNYSIVYHRIAGRK